MTAYCTKHQLFHGQKYKSCRVKEQDDWLHRVATGQTTLEQEAEAYRRKKAGLNG